MGLKKQILKIQNKIEDKIAKEIYSIEKRLPGMRKKDVERKTIEKIFEKKTALLFIPGTEYNETIVSILKNICKGNNKVCYVTLNKTHKSLESLFDDFKINKRKFLFIDAISRTIKEHPDKAENCYLASSPGAFNEILGDLSKCLKSGANYLIFDSLTNLLVYKESENVNNFISEFVRKIKASKAKAVFFVNINEQERLIMHCSKLMDNTLVTWEKNRVPLVT